MYAGHSKWITAIAWEPAHMALPARRFVSGSKDTTVKVPCTAHAVELQSTRHGKEVAQQYVDRTKHDLSRYLCRHPSRAWVSFWSPAG